VSIRHPDGLRTTYEPVEPTVVAGVAVAPGQVLGALGPERHCGRLSCLHWGAIRGAAYTDPLALLGRPPVRLLPMSGARVGLLVGPAQPVDRDVGVALGGRDGGVPEQLLHRAQVRAPLE
jgi:hypothetical protein